ncbi:hypothetical protein A5819_000949 [Enterococcus sp. 7E2_DIV0204]|nr:hypothetical protein A5819_000949 [Enterococcus sp. 7E2_DIV0204]OTP50937.1 hypothetical protein A5884_000123 [Enterococcus sp. 7D2_DIV0200]
MIAMTGIERVYQFFYYMYGRCSFITKQIHAQVDKIGIKKDSVRGAL